MALADLHGISQQLGDRFERYPWYYPLRDAKAIFLSSHQSDRPAPSRQARVKVGRNLRFE
jgi:hypothetical protein